MGARPLIIFGGLKTTQCALLHVGTDAAEEDEIPLVVMAGRMKKFSKNTSTIAEVMDPNTLNLRQILILNFKFSRFFLGGGGDPRPPFGCVLVSLCQSLAYVKISGISTP